MICWITETSQGFTNLQLYRISQRIKAYTYLVLSSQAFVMSHIIGNIASALTAQKAFLINFENVINSRVEIRESIKCYQDILSYTSSKVNYSMNEGIYMLPSDMNIKIRSRTAGYNDEIFVSDSGLNLGRNGTVSASVQKKSSHRTPIMHASMPKAVHTSASKLPKKEETATLVLALASAFGVWYSFR